MDGCVWAQGPQADRSWKRKEWRFRLNPTERTVEFVFGVPGGRWRPAQNPCSRIIPELGVAMLDPKPEFVDPE